MIYDTFTASNSEKGFYSYFDEPVHSENLKQVFLVKGGPGCGKSTFMKKVSEKFESDKYTVERIHCSSDPDSLDGIVVKDRFVMIDATSPHTYDAVLPGARDNIINLGRFWNIKKLEKRRNDIEKLFGDISNSYKTVYNLLKAAGSIEAQSTYFTEKCVDSSKIAAQVKKLLKQNAIVACSGKPKVYNRFLSAFSNSGIVTFGNTPDILCDEYVVFEDGSNIAHLFLSRIASAITRLGYDVIAIHSPLCPDKKLEQVLVPQLRLGFIAAKHPYSPQLDSSKIIRRINTRSYIISTEYADHKNKLSFAKKTIRELTKKAAEDISEIKKLHDKLEKHYIDAMNFEKLNKYTEKFVASIDN